MAPALLAYSWVLKPFGRLGWMAAFLFLLCAALRLARFNVTKPEIRSEHFVGLPSPASAVVIASIVIAFEDLFATRINPFIMVMVVYALAFLMVSNIKYPAFKRFDFKKRVVFSRFLFVILFIYVLATIPRVALFILGVTYAIIGPIGLLLKNKKLEAESSKTSPPPVNTH